MRSVWPTVNGVAIMRDIVSTSEMNPMFPKSFCPELPHSESQGVEGYLGTASRLTAAPGSLMSGGDVLHPEAPSLSPSLVSPSGASEMKFVVDAPVADAIIAWARQYLAADPHAGSDEDGYCVNSLYLDTPNFDIYRRQPGFRRRKFRLRRYGSESILWLELKRKRNGLVRKRRISVTEADWSQQLAQPSDAEWEGAWFRRRLDQRQLRPVCQVTYRRLAHVGTSATGPIRLTIDRDLFATPSDGWQVPSGSLAGEPLLRGRRIVELKFREVLPASFRGLIHDLRLALGSFSKYRESVAACIPLSRLTGECSSPMPRKE